MMERSLSKQKYYVTLGDTNSCWFHTNILLSTHNHSICSNNQQKQKGMVLYGDQYFYTFIKNVEYCCAKYISFIQFLKDNL